MARQHGHRHDHPHEQERMVPPIPLSPLSVFLYVEPPLIFTINIQILIMMMVVMMAMMMMMMMMTCIFFD